MSSKEEEKPGKKALNFIEEIIEEDLRTGKNEGRVHTRFPPEPNGYLHIGHAKSICLNFGLAEKYNGLCNLRFDDTNPAKEEVEYVDSILEDVKWLGFQWHDKPYYASDYFDQLYAWAVKLILDGKAYVDDQTAEEIAANRGTPTRPGNESPFKNRSVEENLQLFEQMKNGEYKDGEKVLRAKIDMSSPNMHLRDPAIYRIKHAEHHRTGNKWCIYPMYDFAHGESDYLEGITHSVCTLEFEVHRPLYDWFISNLVETEYRPRQIEFARLNLNYTVMSKRKLLTLVKEKYVNGWDDPRMPTISGLRRRGFSPESIRNFAEKVGVAKRDNVIDVGLLEFCVREDLNRKVPRVMAVLDPLKIVIINYPVDQIEYLEIENNPEDEKMGKREMPFSREIYIEKADFMEDPPKKYFRLIPGGEVRLKAGYIIKCENIIKNDAADVTEVHCSYDPETKSGSDSSRKVKGTLHWVSATHALDAEVRLYDRLFLNENPDDVDEGMDYKSNINPESLRMVHAKVEPGLESAQVLDKFQFQRLGYFCVDMDSKPGKLVFNRTVTLRDSWVKKNP
ncbi:MAG: glutamine--tRNA ligase/YqeY domain fusion protein [Bacteroidetes bacterium]|nr:glutamine--tRNA ligase/YqeY domain fusion protein [Bacteroidota bacterium]